MDLQEIENHWEGHCFGCSRQNGRGLKLRFFLSKEGCFTKCIVPDDLCGFDGLVHGGIVATLLDEVSAWTIISQLKRFGITREIRIRYFRPVSTNSEIIAEGKILKYDEKNGLVKAVIRSNDGTLLAESEWVFPRLSVLAKMTGLDESRLNIFLSKSALGEEERQ